MSRRDRFGRDVERRKNPSKEIKYDGPLLTENQFNDSPQFRGMTYETYKANHKRFNAKQFFTAHRTVLCSLFSPLLPSFNFLGASLY